MQTVPLPERRASKRASASRSAGWRTLAIAPVIFAAAVFVLPYREPPPVTASGGSAPLSTWTLPPMRARAQDLSNLASLDLVTYAEEGGQPVYRIRAVPHGDELIIDAITGKLLAVREGRARSAPPATEVAAPVFDFTPMKSS